MDNVVLQTNFPDLKFVKRGKVRDIYDLGEHLLLIATDRVSAFDVVLPNGIPGKGRVLTQISIYWFMQMEDIVPHHIVAADVMDFPQILHKYADVLRERSMLVKKTTPLPVECVVRGYLSGSGWKEYQKGSSVCGIPLPAGMSESARLDEPLFTPSTKEDEGHDINITYDDVVKRVGRNNAQRLRDTSIALYSRARDAAHAKGIIIADTKFEYGLSGDTFMVIDEMLTPDSSRFWSAEKYVPGRGQDSYDKQIVRDYLLTLNWDKTHPGPALPPEIIEKTSARYHEILRILTGR